MTFDQTAILSILVVVLGLFLWGKWRYDIVALTALFTSVLFGVVPDELIFSGFGHPATITVALVLILSSGLAKSGAVERIAKLVDPIASIPPLHTAALIFIVAFFSMFMNNVGALALLMPVAIQSTIKAGRSPGTILMPLSFGSILGGMVTLIGTPPNIIIASYRYKILNKPFEMFDFAPVGGTVTLVGLLFIVLIGWRLVKIRKSTSGLELFDIEGYLFEVKVPQDSPLTEINISELEKILFKSDIGLVSLIHKNQKYPIAPKKHQLTANDLLLLEASQEDIDKFVSKYNLDLVGADSARDAILHSKDTIAMEAVVAPGSRIEGKTVEQIRFRHYLGVNLLAVSRQGKSYHGRLREFKFNAGDAILIHGEEEYVEDVISKLGCYPLAERTLEFGKRKLMIPSIAIFVSAIALAVFGIIPIQLSLGIAVVAMALMDIIPVRDLYKSVDWSVIVLLGAMIPVGNALEHTGATRLLADLLIKSSGNVPVIVTLAIILIITMTLSDILNNAATAILMAPIAKSVAEVFGASPDPFLMAVAIGSSCAFLTPIGHQNNALILGPGGYQFGDYWRMGLPLEIIIVAVAVPIIPIFWPLFPV